MLNASSCVKPFIMATVAFNTESNENGGDKYPFSRWRLLNAEHGQKVGGLKQNDGYLFYW